MTTSNYEAKLAAVRAAATATQPPPKPSWGDAVAELITIHQGAFEASGRPEEGLLAEALRARRELGIARYGTPLQHDNGRHYRADAFQQALDLYAYIVASDASDERLGAGWTQAQKLCLALVQLVAERASQETHKAEETP